jgi:Short C-terminal domain
MPPADTPKVEERRLAALAKLDELHRKGVLNDSEFETEKARILE